MIKLKFEIVGFNPNSGELMITYHLPNFSLHEACEITELSEEEFIGLEHKISLEDVENLAKIFDFKNIVADYNYYISCYTE